MTQPSHPDHSSDGQAEGRFEIGELFFSRTDSKGVIQAGNSVFQRVAGYAWEELIGAPHRIVRHPDMPRGIFHMLWDHVKSGWPFGFYQQNRSRSGVDYWVFNVIIPISGGYVSIRLKPCADTFDLARDLYTRIRAEERRAGEDLDPAGSAGDLVATLAKDGYQNYTAFMGRALTDELVARDRALDQPVDPTIADFCRMAETVGDIFAEMQALEADFHGIELIPINLRLQASRSESSGGPVSVISTNYAGLARETLAHAGRFVEFGRQVQDRIDLGLFQVGAARLSREAVARFAMETVGTGPVDRDAEARTLSGVNHAREAAAAGALEDIVEMCGDFLEDSRRMRRFIGGLDVTRVSCRIETGWLDDTGGGFRAVVARLDEFHAAVERRLKRVDALNEAILSRARSLHQTAGAQTAAE